MRIAFVWQGVKNEIIFNKWEDGLHDAINILSKEHEIILYEPWEDIKDVDVILYWEAPCTAQGENASHYNKVRNTPIKKALLFAGGPIERKNVEGFDFFFVESEINEQEFAELNLPHKRAFGVGNVFKPMRVAKKYDGVLHATFADWKRHGLFAESLGDKGAVCGHLQQHDRNGYNKCVEKGVQIEPELKGKELVVFLNSAHVVVNTSSYWGGGQRTTLEAMACGIPVIVMSDSPKNCEYVKESGAGLIIEPDPNKIKQAIEDIKGWTDEEKSRGIEYIKSKWSSQHYADAIMEEIYV